MFTEKEIPQKYKARVKKILKLIELRLESKVSILV
jgi:hypothetical protein